MKQFFANKKFRILLIIEALVLLLALGKCFLGLVTYEIPYSQMQHNGGEVNENYGLTVNSENGTAGYFAYFIVNNVRKGCYDFTINYDTDCLQCGVEVQGFNANYNSVKMDEFDLNPLLDSQEFSVWLDKDINQLGVYTVYDGTESFTVKSVLIKETVAGRVYEVIKLLALVFVLNFIVWVCFMAKNGLFNNENVITGLVIIGITVFASYPLFSAFLTEGDDLVFHLLRIEGIKDGLLSGQFPVRIQPTQFRGYGYASSIFYGELLLYIPAVLRLCGFTLQGAYKVFLILVNFATAFVTYKCMLAIFKDKKIALICCFLYVLAPYRLTNIYVRSAVGEYCAMIFWPVIACGLYKLFTVDLKSKEYKNIWILLTIGYSGVIQTHLISCEIAAAVSVILCLILFKKTFRKETVIELVKFFVMTVMINAYFLVPFLDFMMRGGTLVVDHGSLQTQAIQGNGIYPAQLFNLFVNGSGMAYGHAVYDYKVLGMYNEMGTTVGLALLASIVAFVYLCVCYFKEIRKGKYFVPGVLMTIAGLLAVFMSTNLFPWDALCRMFGSLVYNLQFPWRMFTVATIFLTVLVGCVLIISKNIVNKVFYNGFICVIIFANMITVGYMMYDRLNTSKGVYSYDATAFANMGSASLNEYLPSVTQADLLSVYEPVASENVTVDAYKKHYTNISMTVSETKGIQGLVEVPLLYYAGYEAVADDGSAFIVSPNGNGVLSVNVPEGFVGNINISYEGMWYWHVAELISLAGIVFCVFLVIKYKRENAEK